MSVAKVLCRSCMNRLAWIHEGGCATCQRTHSGDTSRNRCARCERERLKLGSCTARVEFTGDAEKWIHAFKYPAKGIAGLAPESRSIAVALACDAARTSPAPPPDLIVPIPLHRKRLRARGFNPAAALSRAIAKETRARLDTDLLVRIRDTPSQTHLSRSARRNNVRGAFACTRHANGIIWLVDDVVTTGSTVAEAARCLRAAGAASVHAVCVARTTER